MPTSSVTKAPAIPPVATVLTGALVGIAMDLVCRRCYGTGKCRKHSQLCSDSTIYAWVLRVETKEAKHQRVRVPLLGFRSGSHRKEVDSARRGENRNGTVTVSKWRPLV